MNKKVDLFHIFTAAYGSGLLIHIHFVGLSHLNNADPKAKKYDSDDMDPQHWKYYLTKVEAGVDGLADCLHLQGLEGGQSVQIVYTWLYNRI